MKSWPHRINKTLKSFNIELDHNIIVSCATVSAYNFVALGILTEWHWSLEFHKLHLLNDARITVCTCARVFAFILDTFGYYTHETTAFIIIEFKIYSTTWLITLLYNIIHTNMNCIRAFVCLCLCNNDKIVSIKT